MTSMKDKNALQMLLVAYMEDGNWNRLHRALSMPLFGEAARTLHENPAMSSANILHIALRNKPPIEVINCLLRTFPEAPFLPDKIGRYPLHIATYAGCSFEVVQAVAMEYTQACTKQDFDGRIPLHYACDATDEEDGMYPYENHDIDIIRCLVSISPSSVHVEDCDEMNAIELSLLSCADKEVISLLQKVSVLEHRNTDSNTDYTRCIGDRSGICPVVYDKHGHGNMDRDDARAGINISNPSSTHKKRLPSMPKLAEGRFKKSMTVQSFKGLFLRS